jgi:UTP:GlnB (protein PII) uridylyltransferase
MTEEIAKAEGFSHEKLCELRSEIGSLCLPSTLSVVTTGSFGRKEAHEFSDIDFYRLVDNKGMVINKEYVSAVKDTIDGIVRKVGKRPSEGGAFGGF